MAAKINKLRNPDFSQGKAEPRGWAWSTSSKKARWQREPVSEADVCGGLAIESTSEEGTAKWSQVAVCSPETFYRIEADVSCDLTTSPDAATDEAGLVVSVQPMKNEKASGSARVTPALVHSKKVVTIRTYFEAPEDVRRVKISIGVKNASGYARIHNARLIKILTPDEIAHSIAIPALAHSLPAPRVASNVCVVTQKEDRPIVSALSGFFGDANVQTRVPKTFRAGSIEADALLLPDSECPSSIRSLASLKKLAGDRVVVVSLPAFAKLCADHLSLKRVEQVDDPIHAKVFYANYATRGFALHDTFPFAWAGRTAGSFVQNHFRKTAEQKKFCEKNGFVTLLASMCDKESTSDRPICFYKETPGGGLYVLDIDPIEAAPSNWNEPTVAMHFLLTILGRSQTGLGQFVAPVRPEAEFRKMIREMSERFDGFVVQEDDAPVEEVTDQLVTIDPGGPTSVARPLIQLSTGPQTAGIRPWVFVRDGLTQGDVESTYASLLWFKQLVRMPPYTCPYAQELTSQFRLAWIPHVSAWEARDGWRRSKEKSNIDALLDAEGPYMGALIDVVSTGINRARVVFPSQQGAYRRYAKWLPQIQEAFGSPEHFVFGVADGEGYGDRERFAWRRAYTHVEVLADANAFADETHQAVIESDGEVIRVEIPGGDADFMSSSIQRMDFATTLLEQVIGLQFGLIAVNRQAEPIHFDGFTPIGCGEALIVDRRDPALRTKAARVG